MTYGDFIRLIDVPPLDKKDNQCNFLFANLNTKSLLKRNLLHYENMPIQIYRKFHLQKLKVFW